MNNIETIDSLREKFQKKKINELANQIEEIIKITESNGIAFGQAIKNYANWVLKLGEDQDLIEITKEKNKDEKVKNLFIERIKRK